MPMAAVAEVKFTLNVLVMKETDKVIFAEVDTDFADILISFLTLPLGTIVRLLVKHYGDEAPVIGSLNALYKGLENLDVSSFGMKIGKQMLLNPKNPFEPTTYFMCGNGSCTWDKSAIRVSMYCDMEKCSCGSSINKEIKLKSTNSNNVWPGVFTTGTSSFVVTDDLQLMPNFVGIGLQILSNLGINGTDGVEIMDLLKLSLVSMTPLTDLIFHRIRRVPLNVIDNDATSTFKKMTVKAVVQKATGNVSVGSIDNLYRSLERLKTDYNLKSDASFSTVKLPPNHLSLHQIFPLTQQITTSPLYFHSGYLISIGPKPFLFYASVVLLDPKGQGTYIKGPARFIVTNELVVKPLSAISGIFILSSLKNPASDIEEYVIDIGMEEALNILKASLISNSVLDDGLKPILKRQLKEEN